MKTVMCIKLSSQLPTSSPTRAEKLSCLTKSYSLKAYTTDESFSSGFEVFGNARVTLIHVSI
jgi:hypothetical protein